MACVSQIVGRGEIDGGGGILPRVRGILGRQSYIVGSVQSGGKTPSCPLSVGSVEDLHAH